MPAGGRGAAILDSSARRPGRALSAGQNAGRRPMSDQSLKRQASLYYEDFEIGASLESWGRTVTETDVVNFAALSGDWNLIHTDAEYAADQMYGQRVVHGLLVLSISSGQMVRLGFLDDTVVAFLGLDWQFRRPIFIGDTIRTRLTVQSMELRRRMAGGVVAFKVEVLNQDDKVCQRGNWELVCKRRDTAAED